MSALKGVNHGRKRLQIRNKLVDMIRSKYKSSDPKPTSVPFCEEELDIIFARKAEYDAADRDVQMQISTELVEELRVKRYHRNWRSVEKRLTLRRNPPTRKDWTEEEDAFLESKLEEYGWDPKLIDVNDVELQMGKKIEGWIRSKLDIQRRLNTLTSFALIDKPFTRAELKLVAYLYRDFGCNWTLYTPGMHFITLQLTALQSAGGIHGITKDELINEVVTAYKLPFV